MYAYSCVPRRANPLLFTCYQGKASSVLSATEADLKAVAYRELVNSCTETLARENV